MSTALGLAALLSINTSAKATLIAYEGFDYAQNSHLTNQGGGQPGWLAGSGWGFTAATRLVTNVAPGLTYVNGGTLVQSAGSVRVGILNQPTVGNTINRQLANTNSLSVYGSTIWISYLVQSLQTTTPGYYREAKFILVSGNTTNGIDGHVNSPANNGTERLDVGHTHTINAGSSDTYSMWANNATPYTSTGIATDRDAFDGTGHLMLIRLDLDGTTLADTASLWVDPIIGSGVGAIGAANAVVSTVNLDWVNAFRFQSATSSGTGTNDTFMADELRIGTTFDDVTPAPEPSTIALLGVALSGLWLTIRRKRQS